MTRRMTPAERGEYQQVRGAATERAKKALKPGDRISRRMCGGASGTFRFTHWEGGWACGKTVSDCSAMNIYRVNGKDVDFSNGGVDHIIKAVNA
ncbi:hypothetical protein [Parvibaculum sp.]|uniref:hypothetical protein n=1 Tax=Parvibaculum sp. TaxID=2024848 RepID=UPI0027347DF3|nr:hypothetical protein [Parvibaculum sp.]MDP3328746.1 hypothetical protein [Parvibaculum sp.]